MNLHTLHPHPLATHRTKRIARGQGSGKGGTATRGHKGAKSRSGYKTNPHREGGQMPLQRRLPKFGFKNPNRNPHIPISLTTLQRYADQGQTTITATFIREKHRLGTKQTYKILNTGALKTKVDVEAAAFSATAKKAIEALGGKATLLTAHAAPTPPSA